MQRLLLLLIIVAVSAGLRAQLGNTLYGRLDTIKVRKQTCSLLDLNGEAVYKVNEREVDYSTYLACQENIALQENCRPCWMKVYNAEDVLLYEMAAYGACGTGEYRSYYPSGILKERGYYRGALDTLPNGRVNPTTCKVRNGSWTYYKEDGTFWYDETWNNGQFFEQVPNQGRSEVWAIELNFFGGRYDPQQDIIRLDLIGKLNINPRYKNANRSAKVTGKLEVIYQGRPPQRASFTPTSYPYLDLQELLPEGEDWRKEDLQINMVFFVDGKLFQVIPLQFY